MMNARDYLRGVAAICLLGLSVGACTQGDAAANDASAGAPVAAAVDAWSAVPANASATVVQATRTVAVTGGGKLVLVLSCDFRPSTDPVMNGFWLKLDGTLTGRRRRSADDRSGRHPGRQRLF